MCQLMFSRHQYCFFCLRCFLALSVRREIAGKLRQRPLLESDLNDLAALYIGIVVCSRDARSLLCPCHQYLYSLSRTTSIRCSPPTEGTQASRTDST